MILLLDSDMTLWSLDWNQRVVFVALLKVMFFSSGRTWYNMRQAWFQWFQLCNSTSLSEQNSESQYSDSYGSLLVRTRKLFVHTYVFVLRLFSHCDTTMSCQYFANSLNYNVVVSKYWQFWLCAFQVSFQGGWSPDFVRNFCLIFIFCFFALTMLWGFGVMSSCYDFALKYFWLFPHCLLTGFADIICSNSFMFHIIEYGKASQ